MKKSHKLIVGVDIGGSTFRASAYRAGELKREHPIAEASLRIEFESRPTSEFLLNLIAETISSFEIKTNTQVSHLGCGIAAWIDKTEEKIIHSPHLECRGIHLKQQLQRQHPSIDFSVVNDMSAIAVAEHLYGAGKHLKNIAVVFFGTGIGCGLILHGKLYEGKGLAGELGHVRFHSESKTKRLCPCGQINCVEVYAGGQAISKQVADHCNDKSSSNVVDAAFIDKAYKDGDVDCKNVLSVATLAASQAIEHLAKTLDPEVIILGGGFFDHCDAYKRMLMEKLPKAAMLPFQKTPNIVESKLGGQAGVLGAAALFGHFN